MARKVKKARTMKIDPKTGKRRKLNLALSKKDKLVSKKHKSSLRKSHTAAANKKRSLSMKKAWRSGKTKLGRRALLKRKHGGVAHATHTAPTTSRVRRVRRKKAA